MKYFVVILIIVISLFGGFWPVQAQENSIIISELLIEGSSYSAYDEFIEFYNNSAYLVDLSGWYITKEVDGQEALMLTIENGQLVAGNQYFVIANYAADSSILNYAPDIKNSKVALNNDGLTLKLYNDQNELVDYFSTDKLGEVSNEDVKFSWSRQAAGQWLPSVCQANLDENVEDLATPGEANDICLDLTVEEEVNSGFASETEVGLEFGSEDLVVVDFNYASEDNSIIETDSVVFASEHELSDFASEDSQVEVVSEIEDEIVSEDDNQTIEDEEEKINDYSQLIITEIIPDPEGPDEQGEWVEIYNQGDEAINLLGLTVDDQEGGSSPYKIKNETFINAKSYMVLTRPQTKLAFNNTSDQVRLLNADQQVLSMVEYNEVKAGQSYAFFAADNQWQWTEMVTPGQPNVYFVTGQDIEEEVEELETPVNASAENNLAVETTITVKANEVESVAKIEPEYDFSSQVCIARFLPDPEADDAANEWISLINNDSRAINLKAWKLDDMEGGSKPYVFDLDVILQPGEEKQFFRSQTKIALNNSDDAVRLFDPNGQLIHEVSYEDTETGQPITVDSNDNLVISSIEQENVSKSSKTSASSSKAKASSSTKENEQLGYESVKIAQVYEMKKNDLVQVQGVVSVLPGIFSVTYMYIQDEEAGIQVYFSKKDWPDLKIGDEVLVKGKVSEAGNQKRINISSREDILVVAENKLISAIELDLDNLNDSQLFKMVNLTAEVVEKKASYLMLFSNGQQIKVVLKKNAKISSSLFKEGDQLQLSGILMPNDSGFEIWPRSQDDVQVLNLPQQVQEISEPAQAGVLEPNEKAKQTLKYLMIYGAVLLAGGGVYLGQHYFFKQKGNVKAS